MILGSAPSSPVTFTPASPSVGLPGVAAGGAAVAASVGASVAASVGAAAVSLEDEESSPHAAKANTASRRGSMMRYRRMAVGKGSPSTPR